ncbi:hypothetical protein F2Q70_00007041 [Brassica cretica]|uniref:Chromatin target of PRMT1 protein C-terminal domain-containing protein n=1 Tax=Brassica cretica TaxID=69181 RepID=A0A8S9M037_BRACR|nr:hypothetical protein F2Q70_00007041 [Brassica cretica]
MRRLRGRWRAWKSRTKALMDLTEERSKWRRVTRAFVFCLRISALPFSAAPMGARGGGGGGRGSGRGRDEKVSAEDLDAELDKYHKEAMEETS